MGTSTDAHCYACGLDVPIMIGGGMRSFKTFASWPVRCPACGMATTNLKADPMTCLECGSRDIELFEPVFDGPDEAREWERLKAANQQRKSGPDARLDASDPYGPAASWDGRKLSKGRYACPACGEPQLRFGTAFTHGEIMWD